MNLRKHLSRQMAWSYRTFGPSYSKKRLIDHIRKELREIETASNRSGEELGEWVDLILLAFDGAWRSGVTGQEICDAIIKKQHINELREWPDWRTANPDKAIEHVRAKR